MLFLVSYCPYSSYVRIVCNTCAYMMWEQCVSAKKTNFAMKNFGDLRANGLRGKIVIESAIFQIADPDLPFHCSLHLLRGYDDD